MERSPACHKMDNGSYSHSHNNCLCLDPEKPTQTRGEYANCTQASGTSWIRAHNLLAGPFGCEASAFSVFLLTCFMLDTSAPAGHGQFLCSRCRMFVFLTGAAVTLHCISICTLSFCSIFPCCPQALSYCILHIMEEL